MVAEYRRIDGSGNNLLYPDWGQAGTPLRRLAPAQYADGIGQPGGVDRPLARDISNQVFAQAGDKFGESGASNLLWVWGQLIDHDLDFVKLESGPAAATVPIAIPKGDPAFDPQGTGTKSFVITRDAAAPGTGTGAGNPREHVNTLTHWIDASMVYGSDAGREAALRDAGGKLKTSAGDLMPFNSFGLPNGNLPAGGPPADTLFLAGDVRANENPALAGMHTILVREHNRLVEELKAAHPDWDSETLYQEAKARVEAKVQAVTYNEFLPLLVGEGALAEWSRYKPDVNPAIDQAFAAALFRLGHTLLSPDLLRLKEDGSASSLGHMKLKDVFFNVAAIKRTGGVDELMRGLAGSKAQDLDASVIDDVRNMLFGPPGAGGMDLIAINIARGREHGLADYNATREAYGLPKVTSFAQITSNAELAASLQSLYGSVDRIDLFVGALAEDDAPGAMVGELMRAVLVDQFARLRDGDRFWYENRFAGDELEQLQATTLADLLRRNTGIEYVQDRLFLAYERVPGTADYDGLYGGAGRDLIWGGEGDDSLSGSWGDDQIHGDAGLDELFGGAGDDRLYGGADHDYLEGGHGDDRLDGGDGHDELYGNTGDDEIHGGDGGDYIRGAQGEDSIDGGEGDDDIDGGAGDDAIAAGGGGDLVRGGSGDDVIYGGGGDDILRGGNGDDTLEGGEGEDELHGGRGEDSLFGDAGDDVIFGGDAADLIAGGPGDDDLHGERGEDWIEGGDGDDYIVGGRGDDTLAGGDGADEFVWRRGDGHDTILDFDPAGGDVIDLWEGGIAADRVRLTQQGNDTLVTFRGLEGSILLEGVAPSEIDIARNFQS